MTQCLLYGGKGGVGKTTCAAASALRLARDGRETLVASTDPAHSLSDSFETEIGSEPTEITEHLWAAELDPEDRMEQYRAILEQLLEEFADVGVRVEDEAVEELFTAGIAPGSDEIAALDVLVDYVDDDRFEYVVLDTAPTGHTLRLLDLPDVLSTATEIALSVRGQVRRIADSTKRLFLGPAYYATDRETPPDDLAALQARIERIAEIVRDPEQTGFRVVLVPEPMALAETERLIDRLDAFGIRVDGLVVNRVLEDPDPDCDRCRARAAQHREVIAELRAEYPERPIQQLPERANAVQGLDDLGDLAGRIDPST